MRMTRIISLARRSAPAVAALAALLVAGHAHAQMGGIVGQAMQNGPSGGISSGADPNAIFAPKVQPPALPGSHTSARPVAPLQRDPSDMKPNEALFDAINRGDIAAAREALARGAELDAHNVLGLTPTDLSVDLGRNDITFMLLSMRGAPPAPTPGAPAKAAAAPPVKFAAARPAPAPMRPMPAPPPRVLVSDPGTPRPSAGFLGVGAATR